MLVTILVICLILWLLSYAAYPYNRGWGYYPFGGVTLIVVILLVLLLMDKL